MFGESDLRTLRAFYESQSVEFEDAPADDPATPGAEGPRFRYGFQIRDAIAPEESEHLLGALAENNETARGFLRAQVPRNAMRGGR